MRAWEQERGQEAQSSALSTGIAEPLSSGGFPYISQAAAAGFPASGRLLRQGALTHPANHLEALREVQ